MHDVAEQHVAALNAEGAYSLTGTFFWLLMDSILWVGLWLYLDQVMRRNVCFDLLNFYLFNLGHFLLLFTCYIYLIYVYLLVLRVFPQQI